VRHTSVIALVNFGIGASCHQEFDRERFIRCLNMFCYFISYDDILHFEQFTVQSECHTLAEACYRLFIQWAADSVNSNICTIYGMGIMSTVIPSDSVLKQGCHLDARAAVITAMFLAFGGDGNFTAEISKNGCGKIIPQHNYVTVAVRSSLIFIYVCLYFVNVAVNTAT
jgi:hypothetical protein